MTVEKHKTLHTPAHVVSDLEQRVWVLERERCDCRHKDTVKEPDILVEPPAPPPAQAEPWRIVWYNQLGRAIQTLDSLNVTQAYRMKPMGDYLPHGVLPDGYILLKGALPDQGALYRASDFGSKIRDVEVPVQTNALSAWYAHGRNVWIGGDRFDVESAPGALHVNSDGDMASVSKLGRPYLVRVLLDYLVVYSTGFAGPGVSERERYQWDSRWFPGVAGQGFTAGHYIPTHSGIVVRNFYADLNAVWVRRDGQESKNFKLSSIHLVGRTLTLSGGKVYEWGDSSSGFIGDAPSKVPPAEVLAFDKDGCQLESFGDNLYMVCERDTGLVLVVDHVKNEVLYRLNARAGEYVCVYDGK